MNFIDSNIIAYAFYQNPNQEQCQVAIRAGGVTDTCCLIESFNIIELQTTREFATRAIRGILKTGITIIDVNINLVFESLKKSQAKGRLSFLDLVHLSAAMSSGCESMLSYDKDFDGQEIPRSEP